jgi:hypothetical protein
MACCEANRVDYVFGLARNVLPAPLLFINHDDLRLAEFSAGERPDERDHFGFRRRAPDGAGFFDLAAAGKAA